jgi:plastocyanin
MSKRGWRWAVWFAGWIFPALLHAAGLTASIIDGQGRPVEDAAVFMEPASGRAPAYRPRTVAIEQKDRRFLQAVTVVQVGQPVSFPNLDTVRHHVYSLSQAKLFEIKLYAGVPTNPVVFDKPGIIVLGCNIHDTMSAFVRVVDTPWLGRTDAAGRVRIEGVPDGDYRLKVWLPTLPEVEAAHEQAVKLAGDANLAIRIEMRPRGR